MAHDDPDLPLVRQLQSGADEALDELMARHRQRLHRFIWRHIPHEHDALELTQETFVRAYFNIGKFNPRARFVTWLFAIALNLCRDHARSRAYRAARQSFSLSADAAGQPPELPSAEAAAPEILQRREQLRALAAAIDRLPPGLKAPLIVSALEGASYRECAALLGLTEKAVEMKIYRARKILAAKLAAD
ncbi:MAG: RNA polymerase sigma factor [Verrucomicrobiales bacterium]|jgi:RNA polymerase sigma-70 factor (ECF subfamily)|nr:RNA polymerase sigma factor [Verrucomicrobiales bacterium]